MWPVLSGLGHNILINLTCRGGTACSDKVHRLVKILTRAKRTADGNEACWNDERPDLHHQGEHGSLANLTVYDVGADELASTYTHEKAPRRIGEDQAGDPAVFEEEVKEFANDLALHVAAFTSYLSREKVDEKYIAEQVEIFTAQAAKLDKPAKVVEGIVKGKLNKHLSEICFLDQAFVKDDTIAVPKAKEIAKAVGTTIEIVDYAYLKAGWASCAI